MNFVQLVFTFALLTVVTSAQALVFAVNEGVTYRVSHDEIRARYAAISEDMARILRQPVTVVPIGDYTTLRQGLTEKRYDIALVHPAHISILAIKNSDYRLLAITKGFQSYTASFMVSAGSPLASLEDLRGHKLGVPDEDSITSWMVRATLRDAQLTWRTAPVVDPRPQEVRLYYTRYQDAVPFFIENELTHAGASAAGAVVKGWQNAGGKILARSKPVPIKHLIASPAVSAAQLQQLREYFINLDSTEDGKRKLAPTKWSGFAPFDQGAMLELGRWLGL